MEGTTLLIKLLFIVQTIIFSLVISMAVTVPLVGILVRYRANYNPRAVQLELGAESARAPAVHTGPIVKGYFSMMKRVYRIEGWSGLYKGLMPSLLTMVFILILSVIIVLIAGFETFTGTGRVPQVGILGSLGYTVGLMLISLPTTLITYRAITTPTKLPFFSPTQSFRVLLTPTESARPWMLYLTPGLLLSRVIHITLFVLCFTPLQRLILSTSTPTVTASPVQIVLYVVLLVVGTLLFTPLEVVTTRLAIQRNHESNKITLSATAITEGEDQSLPTNMDTDLPPAYSHSQEEVPEEVIGLRSEADPYTGFVDCVKRMIAEEGWGSLYRAWWATLLATFLGGSFV